MNKVHVCEALCELQKLTNNTLSSWMNDAAVLTKFCYWFTSLTAAVLHN